MECSHLRFQEFVREPMGPENNILQVSNRSWTLLNCKIDSCYIANDSQYLVDRTTLATPLFVRIPGPAVPN